MSMMLKIISHRTVGAVISLTVAILVGCYSNGAVKVQEPRQGVVGTIWLKPGYDGEDATYYSDPPDRTPRPLAGVTVYLIKYKIGDTTSPKIIATTQSDSLGKFELTAHPGTYYLAGSTTTVRAGGRSLTPGPPVGMELRLNAVAVVEIRSGKFTEQSLEIQEEVLQ